MQPLRENSIGTPQNTELQDSDEVVQFTQGGVRSMVDSLLSRARGEKDINLFWFKDIVKRLRGVHSVGRSEIGYGPNLGPRLSEEQYSDRTSLFRRGSDYDSVDWGDYWNGGGYLEKWKKNESDSE